MQAEHKLVVLEIESSSTCDTGLAEEAEVHWEEDKKAKLARFSHLKHTFQRTARDCPDVKFLMLEVYPALNISLIRGLMQLMQKFHQHAHAAIGTA